MDFSLHFPHSVSLKKTVSHLDFFFLSWNIWFWIYACGFINSGNWCCLHLEMVVAICLRPHLLYFPLGHEHKIHTLLWYDADVVNKIHWPVYINTRLGQKTHRIMNTLQFWSWDSTVVPQRVSSDAINHRRKPKVVCGLLEHTRVLFYRSP